MNFTALKAELAARGFDYLSDTRLGQFVNWARAELDDLDLWPYKLARISSTTAPVDPAAHSEAEFDKVESVLDTTTGMELRHTDRETLTFGYGSLSTTGSPQWWYIDELGQIAVYPANTTDLLRIIYYVTPSDLLAGSDFPLAPVRFQQIIVDIAVRMAYRDADNHQAAEAMQAQIDRDVNRMRLALGCVTTGPADYIETTVRW